MNPRYPVYIVSKGRADSRLTSRALEEMNVPYHIVVEPQETALYAKVIDPAKILTLPFSNLGLGSIPARNWIWEHSIEAGAARHWILDDNIRGFYRLHRNLKTPVGDGTTFFAAEELADRYSTVGEFGFNYFMFASRKTVIPPLYLNTRIYSCICLQNDLPFRWRGRWNEDTDLSLQILKSGRATILFNAFLAFKETTMTMAGGNVYQESKTKEEDTRYQSSMVLVEAHPDVATLTRKWNRWHHHVNYSRFAKNALTLRPGVVLPTDHDNFGMVLRIADPPENRKPLKIDVMPTIDPAPASFTPDAIPNLDAVDEVAVDFETTGLRWWAGDRPVGLGVAWRQDGRVESRYLPFGHTGGNLPEERVREFLRDLRGKRLAAHNAKFEIHNAREWDAALDGSEFTDTMHLGALLDDHRINNKLETLGQEILDEGKVPGLNLSRGAGIFHAAQITEYGRKDVELVIRLLDAMRPQIDREDLGRVAALESRVLWPVVEMERNAFPIDVELLAEWERSSLKDLTELELKLHKVAGFRVNVGSPTDMERLFKDRGLENTTLTPGGAPSFAGAVLARFQDDEAIALAVRVGKMTDLRSKSLAAYPEQLSDGNLMRYSLNQLRGDQYGTVSGRFSGSQADRQHNEGCNPQQVMTSEKARKLYGDRYDIRKLWRCAEGKLLVAADADQVEFRLFAHYANSAALNKAYADDPHVDFHQAVTDVAREYNDEIIRKLVKNLNFALVFGAGLAKTADMLGVSESEAKKFRAIYEQTFPEAKRLLRSAMGVAERRGYVKTILGRRSRFPSRNRTHKALNTVIQGSNGDYNKMKLDELYQEREAIGFTMRLTVHDEFVGDVEDAEGARRVHEILERQTLDCRIPLLWSYGVGANWAEAK